MQVMHIPSVAEDLPPQDSCVKEVHRTVVSTKYMKTWVMDGQQQGGPLFDQRQHHLVPYSHTAYGGLSAIRTL